MLKSRWFTAKRLLILLCMASLVVYYPSWETGFVTDWMSWIYLYQEGDWTDIINCFGYPGLHQVFHAINYPLYKICGNNHMLWYMAYAIMHGVNTWLVYQLSKQIVAIFDLIDNTFVPLGVGLLFFLSPYQLEPVTWKVCMHYLMSFAFLMGSIMMLLKTLQDASSKRHWFIHHLLFVLALLTLEISLAAPFIFIALVWVYWVHKDKKRVIIKKGLLGLGLNLAIVIAYFVSNKLYIGSWVGHYGEEQHLKFDWVLIGGNGMKYLEKYLLLMHYWPFDIKLKLYGLFDQKLPLAAAISIMVLMAGVSILYFRKLNSSLKLSFFGLLAFFMALFPIANLYFMHIHPYENDRYGYLASFFFYLFMVCVINLLPKYFKGIVFSIVLGLHVFLLGKMLHTAHHAGATHRALVANFPYYDREDILFLSQPDNYRGMCLFRDLSGKSVAFRESLDLFENKAYVGHMANAAEVNMKYPTDGVKVEPIDSLTAQVMIMSEGTWFWKDGFGLSNYENDLYSVELHGWYYLIKFKEKPIGKTLLYFQGKEWKEFNLPD